MSVILVVVLFLSPYIMAPLFMARVFRKHIIEPQWLTYLLTAILLLIYPDLTFWILSHFKAPLKGGQYMCMIPPIFISVFLLPIAMLSQWIFNRYLIVSLHQ